MSREKQGGGFWRLGVALPSLAVAGGLGALGYLRYRFQPSRLFLPQRYPEGIWDPSPFGVEAEDQWFESADGVRLHGWWIPHRRARGTILYCHGHTGNVSSHIGFLHHLHRVRVNILAFDYRGYGRSAGAPDEAGIYQDVQAAWDHLLTRHGCEASEVLLLGQSLGGAVAIDCAMHRPAAGLIVQAAFTDVRDAARAAYPTLPVHMAARNQFRSVEKVPHLEIPKLFIHGDADEKVPLAVGRQLYEAAAEPKEFYVVPHGGHNDLHILGGARYLLALSRFRDRCLHIDPVPQ